jgi:hypothetical protein
MTGYDVFAGFATQELNPYLLSLEMIANIIFSTGMHQVLP